MYRTREVESDIIGGQFIVRFGFRLLFDEFGKIARIGFEFEIFLIMHDVGAYSVQKFGIVRDQQTCA